MTSPEFVPLVGFEDKYEIMNQYPFTIRCKDNNQIANEYIYDYVKVYLNGKLYRKHILIAKQFIPNPNNLPQVDHINHIKTDNRIENLRWVSASDNLKNRSSYKSVQYQFIDDIPDGAIVVDFYETRTERREFEEGEYYYYRDEENDEDIFYAKITDNLYKILHVNISKSGKKSVNIKDVNNKITALMIHRFKYQHDLL